MITWWAEIAGFESIGCNGTLRINGCCFVSTWAACGCQVQFQFPPNGSVLGRKCLFGSSRSDIFPDGVGVDEVLSCQNGEIVKVCIVAHADDLRKLQS